MISDLLIEYLEKNYYKSNMSLAFDEFGKPYIIVREQEKKKRIKGIEAIK